MPAPSPGPIGRPAYVLDRLDGSCLRAGSNATCGEYREADRAPGDLPDLLPEWAPPLPGALSAACIDRRRHLGRSQTPLVRSRSFAPRPTAAEATDRRPSPARAPEADPPMGPRSYKQITAATFPGPIGKTTYSSPGVAPMPAGGRSGARVQPAAETPPQLVDCRLKRGQRADEVAKARTPLSDCRSDDEVGKEIVDRRKGHVT